MSKLKIIIAALILGLGVIGAIFIVGNNSNKKSEEISIKEEETTNNPIGIELAGGVGAGKNLTEFLADKIETTIGEKNKNIIRTSEGDAYIVVPKPEEMVDTLMSETKNSFDPNSLRPKIVDSDLKISEDNSKAALQEYFQSFNKILAENSNNNLFVSETLFINDLNKAKDIYNNTANSFLKLTVPRLALDIHKKEIELLMTKKNIYEKMVNVETDPMTALLASDELLKVDIEFDILKGEIQNFINTYINK